MSSDTIKAIIIEDEKPARDLIRFFASELDNLEIIDECVDGFHGLKAIQTLQPDLIFLDVQMPKLNGFELLEVLDSPVHVIFTTAHDEFAIKAFELNASDYLLKPFSKERFFQAVQKVMNKQGLTSLPETIENLQDHILQENEMLDRIVVKKANVIEILALDNVFSINAEDDYVDIHTKDQHYLKKQTLQFYVKNLDSDQFVRVHRSHIVNVNHILKLERYSKDSFLVILKNQQKIPVSKAGLKVLKGVLRL